jgi:Skp family chaperone for outer membrane proteins
MGATKRAWVAAALVVVGFAAGSAPALALPGRDVALAGDKDEKKDKERERRKAVDESDVYVGDAKKWDKPAEVDADKVYAKIDEYKQIIDDGLKPGDAKYEILIAKASKRFCAAVKKAAKDGGYDLVAKIGAVKNAGTVPDITSDVIAAL